MNDEPEADPAGDPEAELTLHESIKELQGALEEMNLNSRRSPTGIKETQARCKAATAQLKRRGTLPVR